MPIVFHFELQKPTSGMKFSMASDYWLCTLVHILYGYMFFSTTILGGSLEPGIFLSPGTVPRRQNVFNKFL
jgi:hypothetical protein